MLRVNKREISNVLSSIVYIYVILTKFSCHAVHIILHVVQFVISFIFVLHFIFVLQPTEIQTNMYHDCIIIDVVIVFILYL